MKSLELYNMVLRDFFYNVNKPFEEITTNDIRLYLYNTQQTRKICNSTLDGRRTIIHVFCEWAANDKFSGIVGAVASIINITQTLAQTPKCLSPKETDYAYLFYAKEEL